MTAFFLKVLDSRLFQLAVALLIAGGVGFFYGTARVRQQWIEAEGRRAVEQVAIVTKFIQGETIITERVVVKYRTRIKLVQKEGETILKEVVRYVPPSADPLLGLGWLQLYNAAATRTVPPAADGADVTTPVIRSSEALVGIVNNTQVCHAIREQLIALQDWVTNEYQLLNGEAL